MNIRKIKISELLNKPLKGKDKEIVDFIISKISYTKKHIYKRDKKFIYYLNPNDDMEWVLEEDTINDIMWIRYFDFWDTLQYHHLIDYYDIQLLLKYMIEQRYKIKLNKLPLPVYLENSLVEFEKSQFMLL